MLTLSDHLRGISGELSSLKRPTSAAAVMDAADALDADRGPSRAVTLVVVASIASIIWFGIGLGLGYRAGQHQQRAASAQIGASR